MSGFRLPAIGRHAAAFLDEEELRLGERFIGEGFLVLPVEDRPALNRIRATVAALAAATLGVPAPDGDGVADFLDGMHHCVASADLNRVRLAVFEGLNGEDWLRPAYHRLVRRVLAALAGNELAMQRRVNLGVQMPGDDSSLLPVHSEPWSGDSPFELVVWVPLVNVRATKSMFLLPPAHAPRLEAAFPDLAAGDVEGIFRAIEAEVVWPEVPFGHALVFNANLPHGNRVNREPGTRWNLNCRFKSVFSPYADKRLGEFFEPITLRPLSRIALDYRYPEAR